MQSLDFFIFLLNNVVEFVIINICFFLILFCLLKNRLLAGVLDPLFLILVVGFSTKYSIVVFLYLHDLISLKLLLMVLIYALILILFFTFFSKNKLNSIFAILIKAIAEKNDGKHVYIICLLLYFFISIFILFNIGFGILADTNRFENSRGFGAFVRVLDLLSVFIIAFSTVNISNLRKKQNKIFFSLILCLFILFSALINGAKISILFGFMTVFFVLKLNDRNFDISIKKIALGISLGVTFMVVGLTINMKNNGENINQSSEHISGVPIVGEKFINRMVSNGNTAYLILPYDIIDKLATDNFITRMFTPIIGITQMSKIVGYNAGDYSVGRQALLYHDNGATVAGGPTSHFDFFSYVNLGLVGGGIFVAFIGAVLGNLQNEIQLYSRKSHKNNFLTAIYTTVWFRGVILIVEPSVGFAYLFDVFVILILISSSTLLLRKSH